MSRINSEGKYNHKHYLFFNPIANGSTMHVTCGTDIELTCPISSIKKSDEVVCLLQEKQILIKSFF